MVFSFVVTGLTVGNIYTNRKSKIHTVLRFSKNKQPARVQCKARCFTQRDHCVSNSLGTSVTCELTDGGGGLARMSRMQTIFFLKAILVAETEILTGIRATGRFPR